MVQPGRYRESAASLNMTEHGLATAARKSFSGRLKTSGLFCTFPYLDCINRCYLSFSLRSVENGLFWRARRRWITVHVRAYTAIHHLRLTSQSRPICLFP